MIKLFRHPAMLPLLVAIIGGCAPRQASPPEEVPQMATAPAYVAPQSAPVLPPSWPSMAGPVVQPGTSYMPLVQGR